VSDPFPSRYAIPASAHCLRIDTSFLPQAHLGLAGAAVIAASNEGSLGLCDFAERGYDVHVTIDMRRVSVRADQDEVVIHDLAAIDAEPLF